MKDIPPSIFNDVIGPVMRGPSSSHTAASVRIGKLIKQMLDDVPVHALFEFDKEGSLATTYESQGSAIGLAAGLMGWDMTHPDLEFALERAEDTGLKLDFNITSYEAMHPNTYRIKLEGKTGKSIHVVAVSHGGGIVEITSLDEFQLSIKGDYHEILLILPHGSQLKNIEANIRPNSAVEHLFAFPSETRNLMQVKLSEPPEREWMKSIQGITSQGRIIVLDPVMPVLSYSGINVPFLTPQELLALSEKDKLDLYQAAILYECKRSSLTEQEVFQKMEEIVGILRKSLEEGLKGTEYKDRILEYQSGKYSESLTEGSLLGGSLFNHVIASNMAMMEVKSSMGIIVAAPTAGSNATLPGTLFPVSKQMNLSNDDLVKAFLASGLIGVFISHFSTFAAEECGCQAECGSASGMVAAGLVQLKGGTLKQGLDAASFALQNMIGSVCDPVANRVEIPCLGKNIQASLNGLAAANMALAGMDPVVPLEEVLQAMDEAGRSLPRSLRCTGLGGLSITPSSKQLQKELEERKKN